MKKNSYLISLLLIWTTGSAHPFQVIEGSAQANLNQNTLTITNSDGAVLHWTDFSIAKNEKMHFIQPHTQSTVLNRVVGSDKSLIQGILSSNGKVILINPNGIHMNASALIETASFIASTFDFSISNGDLFFKNPGNGEILNEGTITCPNADIIFVANQITNTGSCTAHHVHLLSGSEVLIKPSGKKRIYIQGEQFDQNAPSYTHAIRHSGSIDAVTFQEENGQVFLISSQGTTTVDGSIHSPSGQIHLLGNEVYLTDLADIDASGTYGGTVLIGGDYQGNNPDIQNAQTTTVATGALVKANSTDAHDGGKVIYWSDGITSVGSHTDVSAGALGGDGGFIEVSGKKPFSIEVLLIAAPLLGKLVCYFLIPNRILSFLQL